MPQPNDLSRSLVALDQDSTIITVVEMSQSSWLVAGMLPGIERQPCKKLEPSPERLLALLHRWRDEAVKAGRKITRIALAFEAGRDGCWLARWLVWAFPLLNQRCARRPSVLQRYIPPKACRCRQMSRPSCSATWLGWALLRARSGTSRRLVRND